MEEVKSEVVPEVLPKKLKKFGDRLEVYGGLASMTKGKLTKDDLVFDEKTKKLKSKKAMERGKLLIKVPKKVLPKAVLTER